MDQKMKDIEQHCRHSGETPLPFHSFSCLIARSVTARTMLNRSEEYLCLFPNLGENNSVFLPFGIMLAAVKCILDQNIRMIQFMNVEQFDNIFLLPCHLNDYLGGYEKLGHTISLKQSPQSTLFHFLLSFKIAKEKSEVN